MAIAMLMISAALGKASAFSENMAQADSSLSGNKGRSLNRTEDTLFVSAMPENPLLSYQNLVYKRRLDSLQASVPLSYNEHVQSYIDLYVFKRKEQIGKVLGLSQYYFPIFERSLKEVGVPDELKFISIIESALNPYAVSRSGAIGLWQFMYTTARGYGLNIDHYIDERRDPVHASYAAARYLRDAYNELGDWLLAIAAYNCGTGAVRRAVARAGGNADFWQVRPYLPRETQNYVPAFIATAYVMNYYFKHGIEPQSPGFSIFTDVIDVTRVLPFSGIAKAADIDINELRLLNPAYKKQVVNGSPSAPRQLVIPAVDRKMYSALYDVLNGGEDAENPKLIAAADINSEEEFRKPDIHKVRSGETLSSIADSYGMEVQDLKVWNNLRTLKVVPGQTLRMKAPSRRLSQPAPKYFTYTVKTGDTLSRIVEKFDGLSVSKIKAMNGLKSSVVQPGMRLKLNRSL